MRTRLTLKPIIGERERRVIALALAAEILRLEKAVKETITSSTPRGKTYRAGRITRGGKKLAGQGFKSYQTKKGNTRFVVGSRIGRASAKGQPPAVRTGGLLNANRSTKISTFRFRLVNTKNYAGVLDSPNGLDRPFFNSTIEKFRPGYLQRLQAAVDSIK